MLLKLNPKIFEDLKKLKKEGKKIVTTNGTFDLLHPGHVRYLNKAKALGDLLIVLINSDSSVKQLKGASRPVLAQEIRKEMLLNLKCVDLVIIFNELNPLKYLEFIKPDFHVKGGSFETENIIKEQEIVEHNGGKFIVMSLEGSFSTSSIIDRIKNV